MTDIRTLLEPFDREKLLELLEEQFNKGCLSLKDVRHFVAINLTEVSGGAVNPEIHIQALVSNIIHQQTGKVEAIIESFWRDEQYRQCFNFLLAVTRLFIQDWEEPEDEEWFYRHWEDNPKEVQDYTTFVMFMDGYLARAALMAELEPEEVASLQAEVAGYKCPAGCANWEAEDYLGDEGFRLDTTLRALEDYWTLATDEVEFLVGIYLDIYERWGQHQDYLDLAREFGRQKEYFIYLEKLGRTDQVMMEYANCLTTHDECLELIRAMIEKQRDKALQVAEFALQLPEASGYYASHCYKWLSEHLNPDVGNEQALFFKATDLAMQSSPNLALFKRREQYSPADQWPEIRARYLDYCLSGYHNKGDILVYAGEYDLACQSQEKTNRWYESADILEVLTKERPEQVKAFGKKKAEALIAETNVGLYPVAARILEQVMAIYLTQGREPQWRDYLGNLIMAHRRKRKLVPLLQALERG